MIYLKGFLKIHFIKAQHSSFNILTLFCVQCTDKHSSSSTRFGETPKLENTSYEKSSCKIINNLIVLKTDQLAFASFYKRLRSSVLLFVQFRFKTVRATYMELKLSDAQLSPILFGIFKSVC